MALIKVGEQTQGVTFKNDFGESPLLLAHAVQDQSIITILTLAGAFVGCAFGGLPFAAAILAVGLNDVLFLGRDKKTEPIRTVDVHAETAASEPGTKEQYLSDACGQLTSGSHCPKLPQMINQDYPSEVIPVQPPTSGPVLEPLPSAEVIKPLPIHSAGPTFSKAETPPVDIAQLMAQIPKSTIIAASPRVGKGIVVSQAIENLRRLHPDLEIWLIDPKNEPTERHYWEGIEPAKRCHYDLRSFDVDIQEAVELFEDLLNAYNSSPATRKLLIIDEFVMLSQKCASAGTFVSRLKDFMIGICSSGEVEPDKGIGRFIWVITQSPYVSDLGFRTRAALTTFQRVFLINTPSLGLYQLAAKACFVPDGCEPKVSALLKSTGRVFYYSRSNTWHPVPVYQLSPVPAAKTQEPDIRAQLEELMDKPAPSSDEKLPQLILEVARVNPEGITASMCRQKKNALKTIPNTQIEAAFGFLVVGGHGSLVAVGAAVGFRIKSTN